jgi:hypothetical protein
LLNCEWSAAVLCQVGVHTFSWRIFWSEEPEPKMFSPGTAASAGVAPTAAVAPRQAAKIAARLGKELLLIGERSLLWWLVTGGHSRRETT